MKKIIIMMSTYNGELYVEEQLASINSQIVEDLSIELLVRDDGSKDNTVSILHGEYSNLKIDYIDSNGRLGACKSFLKLIEQVGEADYYAFVDQDDLWDKDKLKTAIKSINEYPQEEAVLWASNCRLIDEKSNVVSELMQKTSPIFTIESQLVCGSLQGCSMVFNRALRDMVKRVQWNKAPMHDIIVTILAINNGRLLYENKPCFSYRVHSNNVVSKRGKSLFAGIKHSVNNWFSSKNKYSIQKFADEIINNIDVLEQADYDYLDNLRSCKKSVKARIRVITDSKTTTTNIRALRSFKLRTLLGIV